MTAYAERLINAYQQNFNNELRRKTVFTTAGRMSVATAAERVLVLPNGSRVRVSTDDSGTATQIEEDDALHAIVRPKSIRIRGGAV